MPETQRQQVPAIIRQMGYDDIDAVINIDRLSFPTTWSHESYQRDILNTHCVYRIAEIDGIIIGYAGMWIVRDDSHITTIAVHPDWRRRGIGRKLLIELMQVAFDRGAEKMGLEVRVGNTGAQHLYEEYGFVTIARLKGYYLDTGEDAFLMVQNPLKRPER
jgi:[ribosomal protein S18]-alanine N-acetyltransferase